MKKIIITVIAAIAVVTSMYSCNNCDSLMCKEMVKEIANCEAYLDTLDDQMPFMDTVGEGDAYANLCDARELFYDAEEKGNVEDATKYYTSYMKYWKSCVRQAEKLQTTLNIQKEKGAE